MKTQTAKLLMINTKINLRMHITHIKGIIEYVDNTVNA